MSLQFTKYLQKFVSYGAGRPHNLQQLHFYYKDNFTTVYVTLALLLPNQSSLLKILLLSLKESCKSMDNRELSRKD